MLTELAVGLRFTLLTMLLFGGAYNAAVFGIGRMLYRGHSEGSLVRLDGERLVGSHLIAQPFTRPEYFHPRPSAVDYNAASTGGSNLGPTNSGHIEAVSARVRALSQSKEPDGREAVTEGPARFDTNRGGAPRITSNQKNRDVPSDLVTASGSGVDPDITLEAAAFQAERVAAARGLTSDAVHKVIAAHAAGRTLGLFGLPRVNVLELNLALDALEPPAAPVR